MKGSFVVQRTENHFSIMAIHQSHGHSNGYINGDVGDSGQYEEPMSHDVSHTDYSITSVSKNSA